MTNDDEVCIPSLSSIIRIGMISDDKNKEDHWGPLNGLQIWVCKDAYNFLYFGQKGYLILGVQAWNFTTVTALLTMYYLLHCT